MISGFEITDIDWNNPDVIKILEFFNKRFDAVEKENTQLKDKIKQLEDENLKLKTKRHKSGQVT